MLQPHQAAIWPLLWRCCSSAQGAAAAELVLRGLLRAYSELRQLPQLLEQLLAASRGGLASPGAPGLAAGANGAGGGGASSAQVLSAMSVAGQLLARQGFLAELAKVVASLPVGQMPVLIKAVSSEVAATLAAVASATAAAAGQAKAQPQQPQQGSVAGYMAAVGRLAGTCLGSIRLELTSALSVAQAAAALVHSTLAAPLAASLQQLQAPAGPEPAGRLLMLLAAYRSALQLHATCAAMHPMVAPLPGQQTNVDPYALLAADSSSGMSAQQLLGSYFSALGKPAAEGQEQANGSSSSMASLPELLQLLAGHAEHSAEGSAVPGLLLQEARQCALQALLLQHQQLLHLRYTCPTTSFEDFKRAKRAADKAVKKGKKQKQEQKQEERGSAAEADADADSPAAEVAQAISDLVADVSSADAELAQALVAPYQQVQQLAPADAPDADDGSAEAAAGLWGSLAQQLPVLQQLVAPPQLLAFLRWGLCCLHHTQAGLPASSATRQAAAHCSALLASCQHAALLLEQPLGRCLAASLLLELRSHLLACCVQAETAADPGPSTPAGAKAAASAMGKSSSKKSSRKAKAAAAAVEAVDALDAAGAAGPAKVAQAVQAVADSCLAGSSSSAGSSTGLEAKQCKLLLKEMMRQADNTTSLAAAAAGTAEAAGGEADAGAQQRSSSAALLQVVLRGLQGMAAQSMAQRTQQQVAAAALAAAVALAGALQAAAAAGGSAPHVASCLLAALQLLSSLQVPWALLLTDQQGSSDSASGSSGSGSAPPAALQWLQALWATASAAGVGSTQLQQLAAAVLQLALQGCAGSGVESSAQAGSAAAAGLAAAAQQVKAACKAGSSSTAGAAGLAAALASVAACNMLQRDEQQEQEQTEEQQEQQPAEVFAAAAKLGPALLGLLSSTVQQMEKQATASSSQRLQHLLTAAASMAALARLAASCSTASGSEAGALLAGLLSPSHVQQQLAGISAHLMTLRQLAQQAPGSSNNSSSGSTWSPELLQLSIPALALLQQLSRLLPAARSSPNISSCQQLLEAHLQLLRQLAPPTTAVLLPSWHADVSWQVLHGPQVGPAASCCHRLSLALLLSLQSLLRACSSEQLEQLHGALLALLQQQGALDGTAAGVLAQVLLLVLETVPGERLRSGAACWTTT